jgi:hypothetical protein
MNSQQHVQEEHKEGMRCVICGRYFQPDHHVGDRQKACGDLGCQRERDRRQKRAWREKNSTYFKGRYEDTRAWRKAHPGYQKAWRAGKRSEIQTQSKDPVIFRENPIKSIRLHLRLPKNASEIQTLDLRLTRSGRDLWVGGLGMPPG